jgi:hypothetical protein
MFLLRSQEDHFDFSSQNSFQDFSALRLEVFFFANQTHYKQLKLNFTNITYFSIFFIEKNALISLFLSGRTQSKLKVSNINSAKLMK